MLELKSYDDIPHLLSPVVTEPAKAVRALKWAVEEMERRYRMMSDIGVRNITGFNEKVRAALAKGKPLGRRIQIGFDPDTGEELYRGEQLDYQALPQIVLIVDELADLMVTVGKEIEVLIQRLSQKSRAAGIHLIMATQRPSVDVITGVIKANLPTRISFPSPAASTAARSSASRAPSSCWARATCSTSPARDPLKRVHGPFVSRRGSRARRRPLARPGQRPNTSIRSPRSPRTAASASTTIRPRRDNPEERKYRQACQIVFESQKASGQWLQRQMGVGYNTAAKWIERMEARRLRRPGEPRRPARHLPRPGRQSALGLTNPVSFAATPSPRRQCDKLLGGGNTDASHPARLAAALAVPCPPRRKSGSRSIRCSGCRPSRSKATA